LNGGITIHSAASIRVHFPDDELRRLQQSIVLCHQELGTSQYSCSHSLVARWFHPVPNRCDYWLGNERILSLFLRIHCKGLFLGNSNLYFSCYALFIERAPPIVPMTLLPKCHALFMEVINLIHYSRVSRSK
jgi:hypothetical protein